MRGLRKFKFKKKFASRSNNSLFLPLLLNTAPVWAAAYDTTLIGKIHSYESLAKILVIQLLYILYFITYTHKPAYTALLRHIDILLCAKLVIRSMPVLPPYNNTFGRRHQFFIIFLQILIIIVNYYMVWWLVAEGGRFQPEDW